MGLGLIYHVTHSHAFSDKANCLYRSYSCLKLAEAIHILVGIYSKEAFPSKQAAWVYQQLSSLVQWQRYNLVQKAFIAHERTVWDVQIS